MHTWTLWAKEIHSGTRNFPVFILPVFPFVCGSFQYSKKKSVHLVSLWLLDASVRLTVLTFYKTQNVGHCLSMCGQNCCAVLNEAHHLFSVAADSPPPPPSVQLPPDATISKVSGGFSLPFLRLPRLVHSTSVYTWLHMTVSPCTLPNANLCRFFLFSVTVEISAKPFIRWVKKWN